jgi:hypothetical protein
MTSMVTNLGLGAPPAAPQVSAGGFDAAWYLSHYPDVAQAIQAGIIRTPEEHYQIWGQKEGRMPNGDTPQDARGQSAVPTGPFQVGGAGGGGAMPQGGAAPDWVQAARRSTQGQNAMPFVLNPQSLGTDQMSNGRLQYPTAQQFKRDLPGLLAGAGAAPAAGGAAAGMPGGAQPYYNALLDAIQYQIPGQGGL